MGLSLPEPASVVSDKPDKDSDVGGETEMLSVSWNQNSECFSVGTSHGFRVYDCDPFKVNFIRYLRSGGFGIVEMFFRSNLMALVGGGENPIYPSNKVLVWDDSQGKCTGELTFKTEIRAVRLREDCIVVVLEHRIYVYDLITQKHIHQIETLTNERGLCCLSQQPSAFVLACPGHYQGQVRVEHFGLKVTKIICAHDSNVAFFAMTLDGLLLATASVKGTLIRIFSTMDGTQLQEVRRGAERAEIYSIAFSPSLQWIVVSSDKGTIHTFSLQVRGAGEDASNHAPTQDAGIVGQNSTLVDALVSPRTGANPRSSLYFMKGMLPKYFSSEWSFAQFHLPEVTRYIAAFGAQNTVLIVGMDGSFYKCGFDPVNGGAMVQQEHFQFLKPKSHSQNPATA